MIAGPMTTIRRALLCLLLLRGELRLVLLIGSLLILAHSDPFVARVFKWPVNSLPALGAGMDS